MPSSGSCLPLACRFSKRSGSRESIQPCRRHQRCFGTSSLFVNPMPPRTTEKSYRPRVSDRTMVDTRASVWLCPAFQNRPESLSGFPSSAMISERSSRSRVRFAAPIGAPLTAPGRSGEDISIKRESQRAETSSRLPPPAGRPQPCR